MRLLLALTVCVAAAAANAAVDYTGYKVLRVQVESEDDAKFLQNIENNYMFWNDIPRKGSVDIMVPPKITTLQKMLQKRHMKFFTMIEDVQAIITEQKIESLKAKARWAQTHQERQHDMNWEQYHTLETIYGWLDHLEATYDYVSTQVIGESYEGTPMRVVSLCQGGCGNKPAIWIDGGIHAREWITPATVTFMLNELTENLSAANQHLIEELDWYILPSLNPDGYAYTQTNDRLWRKTRSNYGTTCAGVDANRNYPYQWNQGGSSDQPCQETYHGPSAQSEIENQNVINFVTERAAQIKSFNSIHSYSQYVLLPWGTTTANNPYHDDQFELAERAYEALFSHYGTEYEIGCIPCLLYVASGGSIDWALGELDIKYTYSLELRDQGRYGFLLPPDQIIPTGIETWAFHEVVAQQIIDEFGSGRKH